VFSYLVVDISSTPDQQLEAKKALFYAAQACRVFLEPSLDALWRVLPSLSVSFGIGICGVEHAVGMCGGVHRGQTM